MCRLWQSSRVLGPFSGLAVSPQAIADIATDTGRWTPAIGDPTVFGWTTVAAYFAVGLLCLFNARAIGRNRDINYFWLGMASLCIILGVNKQLDLQSWFTQVGRDIALSQGWYAQRRIVQGSFIAALIITFGLTFAFVRSLVSLSGRDYHTAVIGAFLLACFIIVRAAAFHHMDALLHIRFGGVPTNFLFEMIAIGVVALGAFRWRRGGTSRRIQAR
jgi:hypothetical protein